MHEVIHGIDITGTATWKCSRAEQFTEVINLGKSQF